MILIATYTENFIVSEFRSGKTINFISKNMLSAKKGEGIKSTIYECKKEVETAILNYILSINKN